MRFFLQGGERRLRALEDLTEYEYFTVEAREDEGARPFLRDMDFAFFAANFGWSLSDYEAITPIQRLFILKEWERKTVRDTDMLKGVVELAIANVHRGKGKTYRKLWQKKAKAGDMPVTYDEAKALKAAIEAKFKSRKSKKTE